MDAECRAQVLLRACERTEERKPYRYEWCETMQQAERDRGIEFRRRPESATTIHTPFHTQGYTYWMRTSFRINTMEHAGVGNC